VLNDCFGDGGEVRGFELDYEIVVSKQDGGIRYVGERLDVFVDMLFGSRFDIDENVTNGHGYQRVLPLASTSPFR